MKVKPLDVYAGLTQDDPADAVRVHGMVDNHSPTVRPIVGAWRWHLVSKHRERIKELVTRGYTIDFGGAAAPIGYGAVIVDYLNPHDSPRALCDVPPLADCVFASHVLEHMVDVENAIATIRHKLKKGGYLVAQVPGWQKTNLWPQNHPYHEQVFRLSWEDNAPEGVKALDTLLEHYGFVVELTDTHNGNVLIIAERT